LYFRHPSLLKHDASSNAASLLNLIQFYIHAVFTEYLKSENS